MDKYEVVEDRDGVWIRVNHNFYRASSIMLRGDPKEEITKMIEVLNSFLENLEKEGRKSEIKN